MSDASLHLVLGEEELLVDRAVAQIVSDVRTRSGTPGDLPVSRLRAGDAGVPELAELLSPSLFAEERIVILESTADAGKDAAAGKPTYASLVGVEESREMARACIDRALAALASVDVSGILPDLARWVLTRRA